MKTKFRSTCATVASCLLIASSAGAAWDAPSGEKAGSSSSVVAELAHQLRSAPAVQARVRAAAKLSRLKLHLASARQALEVALEDDSVRVRAAACAALGSLGDPKALPALSALLRDASSVVRVQAQVARSTLERIRKAAQERASEASEPHVIVEFDQFRYDEKSLPPGTLRAAHAHTRAEFEHLPGVRVVESDGASVAASEALPLVRVGGYLRELGYQKHDGSLVYSARVEYVLYRMPGQAITSTVAGSAKVYADAQDVQERGQLEELRRSAIEAAISSAMRRAPEALEAASRR